MKSAEQTVTAVYGSILADATKTWPALASSFEKDLIRLRRAFQDRGLSFFTITLPDAGKVLDRALDGISTSPSEYPKGYKLRKKRPQLFEGLFCKVLDSDGKLMPDAEPDAVFYLRQLHYCFKKLQVPCDPQKVKEAIDDFFSIEASLPRPSEGWESDVPTWPEDRAPHPYWGESSTSLPLEDVDSSRFSDGFWREFGDFCSRILTTDFPLSQDDWLSFRPKHGPGAVSEGRVRKYSFPNWSFRLDRVFPHDWYTNGLQSGDRPDYEEAPSRLIAVPKTQKGPRLICAEPISHQYAQQAVRNYMEERVRRRESVLGTAIDFQCQEYSGELALQGSKDQSYCTIDLSSASDRLSCRLVEWMFHKHPLLDFFHAVRTRVVFQNISEDAPNWVHLHKFSTQGSALTFPLQTVIYGIIAAFAIAKSDGTQWKRMSTNGLRDHLFSQVRVFGDDIIVPNHQFGPVTTLLEECGFIVNPDKSFRGSAFRESCGVDAFRGFDVTPCYYKKPYDGSPESLATTVDVSNNFHLSGLWNTAMTVVGEIPYEEFRLLPVIKQQSLVDNTGRSGGLHLSSFSGTLYPGSPIWNSDLQREEYTVISTRSRIERYDHEGHANLIQYFIEQPDPLTKWSSGEISKTSVRKALVRVGRGD
uniref:RNA-directed RNA polymerase n=1 Tax=Beihai levi-like virus 3 TaxID=1922416 RepID=A0A1L3KHZ5_9VIRU|nr:hypothetical protein [Beihai levi-like virus 3]